MHGLSERVIHGNERRRLWATPFLWYVSIAVSSAALVVATASHPTRAASSVRYVSPKGRGSACTPATPCALQTGLDQAVAGDEVVLKDGTYYGSFNVTSNSGMPSAPITLRPENEHQAIFEWNATCDWGDAGIYVNRSYWTIEGIRMRRQSWGIFIEGADHVTIQDAIIEDYHGNAVAIYNGASDNTVQRNVIGHNDPSCEGKNNIEDFGVFVWRSANNRLLNNVFLATGNNGYQCAGVGGCDPSTGQKIGYGVLIADEELSGGAASHDNLVQGNMFLANGGKGIFRILNSARNTVRDNAALWGEGGGYTTDHCSDDENSFVNNIGYGNYFLSFNSKGNDTTRRGRHVWRHNLMVLTPFSSHGGVFRPNSAQCGGAKVDMTLEDNVLIADFDLIGDGLRILSLEDSAAQFPGADRNLFWAPSASSTWTSNYVYGPNDIHAAGSRPRFVDAPGGDFTLAPGSPGKNAASDGSDMGIEYNQHLKRAWLRKAFALPTRRAHAPRASAALPVDPGHFYQVWFFMPTPAHPGIETFDVEGTPLRRDIHRLTTITEAEGAQWVQARGRQRWITLGRHRAVDGTLNVSWSNPASATRIFIRQIPTLEEAYGWIVEGQ